MSLQNCKLLETPLHVTRSEKLAQEEKNRPYGSHPYTLEVIDNQKRSQ
jgi:hypothetical protein